MSDSLFAQQWPILRLSEACMLVRNGLSIRQSADAGGLPISRIETISAGEINAARVGYAGIEQGRKENWLLQPGDILLSHINSLPHLGKCAIYQGHPAQLIHGMNLLVLRCSRDILFPKFLLYLLRTTQFRLRFLRYVNQSVNQVSISISNLSSIKIPLPPLKEQKRIAAILDKADAIRRKRKKAISLTEEFLRSAFLNMFGDPVTNPKGWEVTTLGELFEFKTGKLDSNAAVLDGSYPFFTCARTPSRIDTFAFDCEALLLAGNNASADYWVKHYSGRFNAYQRTYVLTLTQDYHSYAYLRQVLEFRLDDLKRISLGTNTKYLTLAILRPINIQVPPTKIQRKFENLCNSVESTLHQYQMSEQQNEVLFNSLVQRAFRGELTG